MPKPIKLWLARYAAPISTPSANIYSSGDRIRTCDLEVMSLASYLAAPPRASVSIIILSLEHDGGKAYSIPGKILRWRFRI